MLIIPIKEGENIDKALKKYKKKYERTAIVKQLRDRQHYTKKSVKRRDTILRAAFRERLKSQLDN
ncbi:MAG: 30S ribosomal protein S21 [Flavobacteriales bacterium]|nr:30S ribosomal protein S21 [Flavobacteriales bacterium]